jgi:lipoate-protein ligase B
MEQVNWLDIGYTDYLDAFEIQERIHRGCCEGWMEDTILFQENDATITLGKSSHRENLKYPEKEYEKSGIKILEVSRGGDISYHGEGQLIISPVIHFRKYYKRIHQYLRTIEDIVIKLLDSYDIKGQKVTGASGVFVGKNKIAAMGIGVVHGVTIHGLSININPDLSHFDMIIPCGLKDYGVTSLNKEGIRTEKYMVRNQFLDLFCDCFNVEGHEISIKKLKEKENDH